MEQRMYLSVQWMCIAYSQNKAIFAGAISVVVVVVVVLFFPFPWCTNLIHFDSPFLCISHPKSNIKSGTKYAIPIIYRYVTKSTYTGAERKRERESLPEQYFLNRFVSPYGGDQVWDGPQSIEYYTKNRSISIKIKIGLNVLGSDTCIVSVCLLACLLGNSSSSNARLTCTEYIINCESTYVFKINNSMCLVSLFYRLFACTHHSIHVQQTFWMHGSKLVGWLFSLSLVYYYSFLYHSTFFVHVCVCGVSYIFEQ